MTYIIYITYDWYYIHVVYFLFLGRTQYFLFFGRLFPFYHICFTIHIARTSMPISVLICIFGFAFSVVHFHLYSSAIRWITQRALSSKIWNVF